MKKSKPVKPNPFMLYMQHRRKEFQQQGMQFPGGWKQVSDLVNEDWLSMPDDEKEHWKELSRTRKEENVSNSNSNPLFYPSTGNPKEVKKESLFGIPMSSKFNCPGSSNVPKIDRGRDKFVVQRYCENEVMLQLKSRFLKLVRSASRLENLGFCFVHFEYYDEGEKPFTLEPAEYACCRWSIGEGIKTFEASLIDTRHASRNLKNPRGERRNEILLVPPPKYTYEMGIGYSVGEDDYGKILNVISNNAVMMTDSAGEKWKYVFTERTHIDVVQECLAWLMYQCDVDIKLRVFPLEPVMEELFRCAATIRKMKERGFGWFCESPDARMEDVKLQVEDYEYITLKGSIDNVIGNVVGPQYYRMRGLDSRLRLCCSWHQKAPNVGGMHLCPSYFVRKWTCLALLEAVNLLDLPPGPWLEFLQAEDITAVPWTMRDAMGIEMRERLGLDPVTPKRRAILEDTFIFPSLLETLKKKHPRGLTTIPSVVIWPVDRDMEVDLNYSNKSVVVIRDPHRKLTLQKRAEKAQRDAEAERKLKQEEYIWSSSSKFNIT